MTDAVVYLYLHISFESALLHFKLYIPARHFNYLTSPTTYCTVNALVPIWSAVLSMNVN